MTNQLLLDFPVLQPNSGNFLDSVRYTVEAENDKGIRITHRLTGKSFIGNLLEKREAVFSVQLHYRDNAEREEHHCFCSKYSEEKNVTVATQYIPKIFSYAPEITPSIVVLEEKTIIANLALGLTEFWPSGEQYHIPAYSRIARHEKLTFTSGDISNLMEVALNERLDSGTMKTDINVYAGEGEIPVTLYCSKDIFDELTLVTRSIPKNAKEAMAFAIITQALCAVYGYMHKEQSMSTNIEEENSNISSVLQAHLEQLQEKTGMDWGDENFNAGLAATIMHPFAIEAIRNN